MSLFSKIGRLFKKALPIVAMAAPFIPGVGGVIGKVAGIAGRIGGIAGPLSGIRGGGLIGPQLSPTTLGMMRLPTFGGFGGARSFPGVGAVGAVGRQVFGAGRAAVGAAAGLARRFPRSAAALAQLGLFAVGGLIYDAAGNLVGKRPPARRINPMNAKAARRAARRIKAASKLFRTIQACLPRQPARCMPASRKRCK